MKAGLFAIDVRHFNLKGLLTVSCQISISHKGTDYPKLEEVAAKQVVCLYSHSINMKGRQTKKAKLFLFFFSFSNGICGVYNVLCYIQKRVQHRYFLIIIFVFRRKK